MNKGHNDLAMVGNDVTPVQPESNRDKQEVSTETPDDPWAVTETESSNTPWAELSIGGRVWRVVSIVLRLMAVVTLLYLFICSLDFLSSAFRLLGGRAAGAALTNQSLLDNPVCGLMIGVLVTVLLQSSSTSTSIIVTMVASNLIKLRQGIFIVMGANIGTSVTNTIVSLAQSGDRNEFRRAFAAATVHDMFNWLTVLIFLPIEALSGVLERITHAMTRNLYYAPGQKPPEMLKALTRPFTQLIIQIDSKVIEAVATKRDLRKRTMIKYFCPEVPLGPYLDYFPNATANMVFESLQKEYWTYDVYRRFNSTTNMTLVSYKNASFENSTTCRFLFHGQGMQGARLSETAVGVLLLVIALTILMTALISMVKILHSLLRGPLFSAVKKVINAEFPGYAACLTGYVAILVGAGMTMLVQSSSIFTSTLTPLVGIGVVTLERVYPLTLGSNIGTTFTGMLAALVQSENKFREAMQLALCHLFFNIFGISIFYPLPVLRKLPIHLAKGLGNTTANYRWFAVVYVICIFFVIPGIVFGLSIAGWQVLLGVGLPIVLLLLFIIVVNVMQKKKPNLLPVKLKNWEFLPKPLHSLEPYDRGFKLIKDKTDNCCSCCGNKENFNIEMQEASIEKYNMNTKDNKKIINEKDDTKSSGNVNPAFISS